MTYTAISFAPVQGFIEKSRKLRDLYGASIILSYLSQKIVEELHQPPTSEVISPALINVQEGMPNRILVKGDFIERDRVQNILLKHWQHLLLVCREWIEDKIPATYHWAQTPEQIGVEKGVWERWGSHTWEVFWGYGDSPQAAMESLENNKLKRDWTGINWVGESSSLSGIDAIAWPRLGERRNLRIDLTPEEKLQLKEEQELFYRRLSWVLDNPEQRLKQPHLDLEELRQYEAAHLNDSGRYIAINERLSVPELVKRLITYDKIDQDRPPAEKLGLPQLKNKPSDPEFKDINREAGYWTGWFMGDGDKVGEKLKALANRNSEHPELRDHDLQRFTGLMRDWSGEFKKNQDLFPGNKGRVIYAGGDDFLGVLYSEETGRPEKTEKVKPIEAWNWLLKLPQEWQSLQVQLKQDLKLDFTYSVGFVWAGHQVPQRDILQHCREAEKRSKNLGRNRLTIRVVFNSGQKIEWTCPWSHLKLLNRCTNWVHLYQDWAHLRSRNAIRLRETEEIKIERDLALAMLDLYFDGLGQEIQIATEPANQWKAIVGDNSDIAIVRWVNDLVQVGWQLCSNSNI
jgi:CRISPR-associated protein Cmr2